jgi:indole-3-glycerol phosphate synthase
MSEETNVTTPLTLAGAKALDEFITARNAKKDAEKALRDAEKRLRAELGNALEGTVNGIAAVKVISSQNSHISKELLEKDYPEIYAQTLVTTPYTYLKAL